MLKNKNFKFFTKINLDEVTMMYVGLSANSERSMTLVLSKVYIPVNERPETSFSKIICRCNIRDHRRIIDLPTVYPAHTSIGSKTPKISAKKCDEVMLDERTYSP